MDSTVVVVRSTGNDLGLYERLGDLAQGPGGENIFLMFTPTGVQPSQTLIMQVDGHGARLVPVSADNLSEHVPAGEISTMLACREVVAEHGLGFTLVYAERDVELGPGKTLVIRPANGAVTELVPIDTAMLDVRSDVPFVTQVVRLDDTGALAVLRAQRKCACWGDDNCDHKYPK